MHPSLLPRYEKIDPKAQSQPYIAFFVATLSGMSALWFLLLAAAYKAFL
jgi:hypothetical protein